MLVTYVDWLVFLLMIQFQKVLKYVYLKKSNKTYI